MAAMITTPRLMAVGGGALAELPSMLAQLRLAKPLIVTVMPAAAKARAMPSPMPLVEPVTIADLLRAAESRNQPFQRR